MRRLINKIALLAAALMIMVVPVLADDLSAVPSREPETQQSGKDQCLIVAMNCGDRAMSVQNRIDKIQNEMNKGAGVYSAEELGILQRRLDDANRELIEDNEGGV